MHLSPQPRLWPGIRLRNFVVTVEKKHNGKKSGMCSLICMFMKKFIIFSIKNILKKEKQPAEVVFKVVLMHYCHLLVIAVTYCNWPVTINCLKFQNKLASKKIT